MILDPNALSAFADGDEELRRVLEGGSGHQLPVIVLGEFSFEILSIDGETAQHYADIREELRQAGNPIPQNDLWIAALARQHHLPVVSRDVHFDKVKKVKRHGW